MQCSSRGLVGLGAAAALAVVCVAALLAQPSDASFPGANGKIVFASNRTGDFEIWMMNGDGSNLTQLTHTPNGRALYPAVSSDGKGIVFASNRGPGADFEIYSMTFAGDQGPNAQLHRWTENRCLDKTPAFAPGPYLDAQSKIVYAESCGGHDLNIMKRSFDPAPGGGASPATQLTSRKGDDLRPSYSPDGHSIVYDAMWPKGSFSKDIRLVTVMNPDGTSQDPFIPDCSKAWKPGQPLPNCTEETWAPSFSPDGKRIAYSYFKRRRVTKAEAYHRGIAVMDSNGRDPERVTDNACSDYDPCGDVPLTHDPAWSPTGTHLVYERAANGRSSVFDLWSKRARLDAEPSRLTTGATNVHPDFGPAPQP